MIIVTSQTLATYCLRVMLGNSVSVDTNLIIWHLLVFGQLYLVFTIRKTRAVKYLFNLSMEARLMLTAFTMLLPHK